jgi:hypothetical protein
MFHGSKPGKKEGGVGRIVGLKAGFQQNAPKKKHVGSASGSDDGLWRVLLYRHSLFCGH